MSDNLVSLVAVVYTARDLKEPPYSGRLGSILDRFAQWLGDATYRGDVFLGQTVPKYKQRNRGYKLPKNIQQLQDEVKQGKLWNLSIYDRDDFSGSALDIKMQPDSVLGAPASIYISVTLHRFESESEIIIGVWKQLFQAVDEAGWGFVDITTNLKDYLFKLDGVLYGHFPDMWKKELDIWKKNRSRIEDGILDVYWKNLWSPIHVKKLGGMDQVLKLLNKEFNVLPLPSGGVQVEIPFSVGHPASQSVEQRRGDLRLKVSTLLWEKGLYAVSSGS